jgi:dethiobiotin synthetase
MADLLVTGTDTGVGKTVIAAALLIALRERGERAIGFKPAETGVEPGVPRDSEILAKASGLDSPLSRPILRLPEMLAPAVAAERANCVLEPAAVDERIRGLHGIAGRVVVEGAGGALAPLAWNYTILDVALRHELEAVIVARAGLGTLNLVALTFEALRSRRIPIRAVVLNGRSATPTVAEETNPAALRRILPAIPVFVVPRHDTRDTLEAAYASVPLVANLV